MIKNKNILITGGCGFVGSNIAENLATENHIIIIDNLISGKKENITEFQDKVEFINTDIRDYDSILSFFEEIDLVFHAGANIFIEKSIKDPKYDAEVNVIGTINVLEACRKCNVKRLIFSSSSAVYGDSVSLPIKEDHPIKPDSPYAITKRTSEYYCKLYAELYGLKTVSLRYFNVYGSRQDPYNPYSGVIAIFVNNALNNLPLTIYGDGEQTRDFIHVNDIVNANILAAETKYAKGNVFNVGTGRYISINQLVEIIKQLVGNTKVKYEPARLGDIRKSVADISLAKEILGFEAKIKFERGLENYITWCKERFNFNKNTKRI